MLLKPNYFQEAKFFVITFTCLILEVKNGSGVLKRLVPCPYSVDSIKRTVAKKNFKRSLLEILFTISKQYF